jgi:hypothetical protein
MMPPTRGRCLEQGAAVGPPGVADSPDLSAGLPGNGHALAPRCDRRFSRLAERFAPSWGGRTPVEARHVIPEARVRPGSMEPKGERGAEVLDDVEYRRRREAGAEALSAARVQAEAGFHNWACFLAEQSAQLSAKGLLHGLSAGGLLRSVLTRHPSPSPGDRTPRWDIARRGLLGHPLVLRPRTTALSSSSWPGAASRESAVSDAVVVVTAVHTEPRW